MTIIHERFVAVAVESTGYTPGKNSIIAIGLAEIMVYHQMKSFYESKDVAELTGTEYEAKFKLNLDFVPKHFYEPDDLVIHYLDQGSKFADAIPVIMDFIDGAPLIGHNIGHCLSMLRLEYLRAGKRYTHDRHQCTLRQSRDLWGIDGGQLEYLCRRLGVRYIDHEKDSYEAIYDARATAQCWIKMRHHLAKDMYDKKPRRSNELNFM